MRRRAIDSLLPHMPKRIGTFWIEVARLVTLQRHRTRPDEKRVKRNVTKKIPHS